MKVNDGTFPEIVRSCVKTYRINIVLVNPNIPGLLYRPSYVVSCEACVTIIVSG